MNCPICNHKEHKPGRCSNCNCGQSEISVPHGKTQPVDLEIDPRGPAIDKGRRIKRKKTDN